MKTTKVLQDAQKNGTDIHSQSYEFVRYPQRRYMTETDQGKRLIERMEDMNSLLDACRKGIIPLTERPVR